MRAGLAKLSVVSIVAACSVGEPPRFGAWEPIAAQEQASAVSGFDAADYADGKLFVWGDTYSRGFLYDVATDTWRETSDKGRPQALLGASALWANGRVLLWGDGGGAIYDPVQDAWSPIASQNAPASRIQHAAVWTGSKMLVWGGEVSPDPIEGTRRDGGVYDPATNTWAPMATEGAPTSRVRFTTVWTGAKMVVWGGQDPHGFPLGDGATYDPATNTWQSMAINAFSPKARYLHTAVWTGTEMFVWAGLCADDPCIDGAAYDPVKNDWRIVSPHDAATKRFGATGVWTGHEVVLFSGINSDDGYRWEPIRDAWTRMSKTNQPAARGYAFSFWDPTKERMLLWGGADVPATGGFYRP